MQQDAFNAVFNALDTGRKASLAAPVVDKNAHPIGKRHPSLRGGSGVDALRDRSQNTQCLIRAPSSCALCRAKMA